MNGTGWRRLITTGALVVMAMVVSAGTRAADYAVFEPGNDLYRDCTSVDLWACIGYIKGIKTMRWRRPRFGGTENAFRTG
jgi:hypothetical protein